jgi:hypothetical protein
LVVSDPAPRLSWWSDLSGAFRVLWLPLLPGSLIVVGAYSLWLHTERAGERSREVLVESEAGRVREELLHALDQRATLLRPFATAGTANPEAAPSVTTFRAVLVLDSSLAVRAVIPASARVTSTAEPADDDARAIALRAVTGTPPNGPALVATAPLASGERQLLACMATDPGGGFVVGVERERDVLDAALTRSVRGGFAIGVYEGSDLVYGSRMEDGGPGIDNAREDVAIRDAVMWRIQLWPAAELTRQIDAHAPLWILALGTLLGFFVSLCVYMWREGAGPEESEQPAAAHPMGESGPGDSERERTAG